MIQRYEADADSVYRRDDGDFIYYTDHLTALKIILADDDFAAYMAAALAASSEITDEQVEAAARVITQRNGMDFDGLTPRSLGIFRSDALAILEAARAAGGAP